MFFNYLKNSYSGWLVQKNVIKALVYRELKTKISNARLGFIGVLIEPFVTLGIFISIFAFFRIRAYGGLNVFIFLGIGFIYFKSFQKALISSLNSIDANRSLFSYKEVKPVDTIITRCLVEGYINLIILIILFLITFLAEDGFFIDNFPMLILSFILLNIFCLAIGIIFMVAAFRYDWVKISIPFLSRPLFFTSGVLFSLRNIPQTFHPFLKWNPILHSIEVARNSVNSEYILVDGISIIYVLKVIIITLTVALFIYINNIKLLYGK